MRNRRPAPPTIGQPSTTPAQGIAILRKQIESGEALLANKPIDENIYGAWVLLTKNYLEKAFGANSPNISSITDVGRFGAFPMNASEAWNATHRAESLQTQLTNLRGLVELLRTEVDLGNAGSLATQPTPHGRRVFLAHGHDERALHETARFLEKLELDPIVLREQPSQGRTIVEKFEDYGDVGFAVVLLTADDRGGPANLAFDQQMPRARQNVIFELGYFIGRLGRNRVCALHVQDVEIPSDYSGVLYVALDSNGAWRLALARELKAAGLTVDMNNAV